MSDRNLIPPADPALVGRIEQLTTSGTGRRVNDSIVPGVPGTGPWLVTDAHRTELDALRARVAELEPQGRYACELFDEAVRLRAENARLEQLVHDLCFERAALYLHRDRLRAALEAAPEPGYSDSASYHDWHDTTRREALDG